MERGRKGRKEGLVGVGMDGLTTNTCLGDKYICLSSRCHTQGNIYLVNEPMTVCVYVCVCCLPPLTQYSNQHYNTMITAVAVATTTPATATAVTAVSARCFR